MIIGLLITIFYLLYVYEGYGRETVEKKDNKRIDRSRKGEFECPRCHGHVDADSTICMDCGAEFETDRYSCPLCGVEVSDDDEVCPECGEPFIVDEKEYVCPTCKAPVDVYATECKECNSKFWSPVKRYKTDLAVDKKEDKKIDPNLIEIVGDDQD